jgi:hypothetical protein
MSRGSTGLTAVALAGWAMIASYWMQPEALPPIPSFVAFCGFLFAVILIVWLIDEASDLLRSWRRRQDATGR